MGEGGRDVYRKGRGKREGGREGGKGIYTSRTKSIIIQASADEVRFLFLSC